MSKPDLAEVDAIYQADRTGILSDSDAEEMIDMADRLANDVFGGRIRATGETEGNEKDFKKLLSAHLWELSRGGETGSEGQTGGNVTYNVVSGDVADSLGETRYGRMASVYIRNNASIGVEKT